MTEQPLDGGNVTAGVVRVGDTVRKPWLPTTERTVAFMDALRSAGVDVPRTHGRDEQGRLVLDYVPGTMAIDLAPLPTPLVRRVGTLLRAIHDASAELPVPDDWEVLLPAPTRELVCHNDVATWNLVVDGDRLVLIDWDGAGPSSRAWDLAYAATAFAHLFPGTDLEASDERLAAFVDGYDADDDLRHELVALLPARADAMHDLLRRSHADGVEPWGSMYVEGHGEHWAGTAALLREELPRWRAAVLPAGDARASISAG